MKRLQDMPLQFVSTNGISMAYRRMGHENKQALVLLHGYPQNHLCWEHIAPTLAQTYDIIVPDLRGYGHSDAPFDETSDHRTYSKREMAKDVLGLMDALNIPYAHILGHDRGGRVAYRLALDSPERVNKLGIIEIVPTGDFWTTWDANIAMKAYHWTFLAQPYPLPERMINADPTGYIEWTLKAWTLGNDLSIFSQDVLQGYLRQTQVPERIHAMCADYRAGATFDRILDQNDRSQGRKIVAPLKFLWAENGFPAQTGNPASLWEPWATTVEDVSCESGHFVMEENPKAVIAAFEPFFQT